LIVLGFKNELTADEVVPQLERMQGEGLLELGDWARVIRREDGRVDVRQAASATGAVAAGGALVGVVIGLLFLMPLAGLAVGAGTGVLVGKLADFGIDDTFVKDVGRQITPGTSALFLYVLQMQTEQVIPRLRVYYPTLVRTSLPHDAEERLRQEMQTAANV
jgi:uncharacterized membrane protein